MKLQNAEGLGTDVGLLGMLFIKDLGSTAKQRMNEDHGDGGNTVLQFTV